MTNVQLADLLDSFVIFAAYWFWNLSDRLSLAGEGFFSFAGEVSKQSEEY